MKALNGALDCPLHGGPGLCNECAAWLGIGDDARWWLRMPASSTSFCSTRGHTELDPRHTANMPPDTRNTASSRVLEKLRFAREGTLREDCIVDGEVSDSWVYGLLRREWEQLHSGRLNR
ncbi:MAG TPA: GNAT family protein [Burkholderiaceae bacterium]